MAVINNIDDFSKYKEIIKNIASGNEEMIRKRILNNSEQEMKEYLKYRDFLKNYK